MNIDISIPEDEIKQVLTTYVAQKMPTLNVKDIEFKVSRNPNTIAATVVADFGGTVEVVTTTTPTKKVVSDADLLDKVEAKGTTVIRTDEDKHSENTDSLEESSESEEVENTPKRKLFGKKTAETEED